MVSRRLPTRSTRNPTTASSAVSAAFGLIGALGRTLGDAGVNIATFHLGRAAPGGEALDLPLTRDANGIWRSDWAPLLPFLADDTIPVATRAGAFHETMAAALVAQAQGIRAHTPFTAVGLTGGVFQNRLLTERVCERLAGEGIDVRLHETVPANDGGLCFGQVVEAAALQND